MLDEFDLTNINGKYTIETDEIDNEIECKDDFHYFIANGNKEDDIIIWTSNGFINNYAGSWNCPKGMKATVISVNSVNMGRYVDEYLYLVTDKLVEMDLLASNLCGIAYNQRIKRKCIIKELCSDEDANTNNKMDDDDTFFIDNI
ncbi:hypothetical protein GXP67_19745 [Rhodocytophaga rosea]|uniref:Uncharacterized protein n=1 Tax=Rhodocytophaga rosea TaxID=2704465 RepID=A0A6C0GL31_9BACT|nr:hypothetical protein [Rhodocytophaga rosea]QHT68718.1 hypothetical protein GXP67_19745 [Rhodocytophaga rosea]